MAFDPGAFNKSNTNDVLA